MVTGMPHDMGLLSNFKLSDKGIEGMWFVVAACACTLKKSGQENTGREESTTCNPPSLDTQGRFCLGKERYRLSRTILGGPDSFLS
jgi:hypothetical protein